MFAIRALVMWQLSVRVNRLYFMHLILRRIHPSSGLYRRRVRILWMQQETQVSFNALPDHFQRLLSIITASGKSHRIVGIPDEPDPVTL